MKFFKQIKKNPLFEGLTDNEVEALFDCLSARIVKKYTGTIIARPSDIPDEVCIVIDGNIVAFVIKNNGDREVITSIVDGGMYGLEHCFTQSQLNYYVASARDTTLLYIKASSLLEVCSSACEYHTKIIINTAKALSQKIMDLENNNGYMTIKGMRRKIAKLIYDKYLAQSSLEVHLEMDRNQMAKFLNVSRPSMSREMMKMRDDDGIFTFRKDAICITDLEKLKKIVEETDE